MADLQVFRREDKYLLSAAQATACQARIASILRADPHNGTSGYLVRSLYFDTAAQRDFYAQQNGEYIRRKIRLRIYGENDPAVKLECKAKQGDYQHKTSLLLSREDALRLCRRDFSPLSPNDPVAAKFLSLFLQGYRPSLLVQYHRAAYSFPFGSIRITFDRLIESRGTDLELFAIGKPWSPVLPSDKTVLEVKYAGELPPAIKNALLPYATHRNSFSKFGLSHQL